METDELLRKNRDEIERELKKFLPEKIDSSWLKKNAGMKDYDIAAVNAFMTKPTWDLLGRGGKRWRPLLMLLCCGAVGGNPEKNRKFAIIPEIIHNGTLVQDDIEDNSEIRRGKPALHIIYGIDTAVNLASMLYYLPLLIVRDSRLDAGMKARIYELVNDELLNLHLGQGTDITWHRNATQITESKYFAMCANKTGTLARMAAKLGAILGKGEEKQVEALGRFAEGIGIAFQIQDDVLNLTGGLGKTFGEDITEGKISMPVIIALKKSGENDRKKLLHLLRKHSSDRRGILEAIAIIKKCNALEQSGQIARKIVQKSWADAEYLLPASEYKNQLKQIADFMTERKA